MCSGAMAPKAVIWARIMFSAGLENYYKPQGILRDGEVPWSTNEVLISNRLRFCRYTLRSEVVVFWVFFSPEQHLQKKTDLFTIKRSKLKFQISLSSLICFQCLMWKTTSIIFSKFIQFILNIQRTPKTIHKPEIIQIIQFICEFVFP